MVGELAVIDGLPRSATAVAATKCELSFITRHAFEACLQIRPDVYRCLLDTLAARLRQSNDALGRGVASSTGTAVLHARCSSWRSCWARTRGMGEFAYLPNRSVNATLPRWRVSRVRT